MVEARQGIKARRMALILFDDFVDLISSRMAVEAQMAGRLDEFLAVQEVWRRDINEALTYAMEDPDDGL